MSEDKILSFQPKLQAKAEATSARGFFVWLALPEVRHGKVLGAGESIVSEDNIVSLQPMLQAKAEATAGHRLNVDRSAEQFRMLVRATRDRGASTKEIAHTLRTIADELDNPGGGEPA